MDKFNEREIITNFAKANPTVSEIEFIREDPDGVSIKLLNGGIVNYVYHVKSKDNSKSIILKHFRPGLRIDPTHELPMKRQTVEYESMLLMNNTEEGCVPTPYCLDTKHQIIAMKDLTDWTLFWVKINEHKDVNLKAAAHLGSVLGKIHKTTARVNVSEEQWKQLAQKFRHPDSVERMTDAFHRRHQDRDWARGHLSKHYLRRYNEIMRELKDGGFDNKIVDIYKTEISYVHPDVHAGNMMTNGDKIAILDHEWNILSHPAINLGYALSRCYVEVYLNAASHQHRKLSSEAEIGAVKEQTTSAIRTMMESYLETRDDLPNADLSLESLFSTTTLLLATHVMNLPTWDGGMDSKTFFEEGYRFMIASENVKSFDDFMALFQ